MIRTILYAICYWIVLLLSFVLFIPYFLFYIFGFKKVLKSYIFKITSCWARGVIVMAGGKVEVKGRENVPLADNVCFISNHQGFTDIPLIMGYAGKTVGFITKKELAYIPLLSTWMRAIHCVFLDRKNKKQSLKAIASGVRNIKEGFPMLVFPEGTRSKGGKMGKFKSASLRIAIDSDAVIVPLTVNGTYKLLEEKARVCPGKVSLVIHPPINCVDLSEKDKNDLSQRLWDTINSSLINSGETTECH